MASLMRRKAFKSEGKVTAIIENELSETTLGRHLGFTKEELKTLFKGVRGTKIRIATLNQLAYDSKAYNMPLSKLIKLHLEERERLR